jgi:hypothetical protein
MHPRVRAAFVAAITAASLTWLQGWISQPVDAAPVPAHVLQRA